MEKEMDEVFNKLSEENQKVLNIVAKGMEIAQQEKEVRKDAKTINNN